MRTFVADFETTTQEEDCRVWAYALCDIENIENKIFGNSIDEFMELCSKKENKKILFHKLEWDGLFIIDWLFKNNFKHTTEQADRKSRTFNTLINDKGIYYQIEVIFNRKGKSINKVTFQNSYNIIPMSADKIAKNFRMPVSKLKIDYEKERPIGYKMTEEEKQYISNDVEIIARAMKFFYEQGLNKMTIGSCALAEYKNMFSEKKFRMFFPTANYDEEVRESYRGGYNYLEPEFENKIVDKGIVLDINSTHPYTMYKCELPYGEPIFYRGEYEYDEFYPIYVQAIRCQFELKEGYIPTVQIRHGLDFNITEYLRDSGGVEVVLWMTSIDLEIFFKHYNVYNIEYFGGWKFKACTGLFDEYIEKWSEIKIQSKKEENWALYEIAKLMLNSLYGKFGTLPRVRSKIPYLAKDGTIEYKDSLPKAIDGVYLALATFVTAYSRQRIINAYQKVNDAYNAGKTKSRAFYTDTDSLHIKLNGESESEFLKNCGLEIDETALGKFKIEGRFDKGKYLRGKCYIQEYKDPYEREPKMKITVAGMPETCHDQVTFDNFKIGTTYHGKRAPVRVPGGVILGDVDFTLKENLFYEY